MKVKSLLGIVLTLSLFSTSLKGANFNASKQAFDFDWKFYLGDNANASKLEFNDLEWRTLDVPHDFSIEQPFDSKNPSTGGGGYAYGGIGWYRKHFVLDNTSKDKRISVLFNGVYRNSEVWINGHYLGYRPYGYTSFYYDLTPYLNPVGKENVIAVKVNTSEQQNSRWYTGAGIYRHVWLITTGKVHFEQWGVCAQTLEATEQQAKINIAVNVFNEEKSKQNCEILTTLIDAEGHKAAFISSVVAIQGGDSAKISQTIEAGNIKLWSIENPYLYRLQVELKANGKTSDISTTNYGIRTIKFDPNLGFLLNGKHVKLKGTNNHHDGGPLGSACLDYTFERQLKLLKEMGCNALRMSHNPPAPELLDAADRMGFVVIDEIFDEWMNGKTPAGYSPHFKEWYLKDVENWIKRDRNHPSVIAWSIGNEVKEQWDMAEGSKIARMLKDAVLKYDTTRPTTAGCNGITGINANGMGQILGIVGYNYEEAMYEKDHKTYPQRVIYGTETLQYPYHPGKWDQFRSYAQWLAAQKDDYVAGEFIWTGFDYLGEAGIGEVGDGFEFWKTWPGWPTFGATCGLLDICGFNSPGYWFRRALWTNEPIVYIAVETDKQAKNRDACSFWAWPKVEHHWNHSKEGDTLAVHVYTNIPDVELKLNGQSLGAKHWNINNEAFLVWNVSYKEGTLEAIGTLPDGKTVKNKVVTAGKPYKIQLVADRETIKANKQDLCYVQAFLLDQNNNPVPFADNEIEFEVTGAGKLNAVGNGNLKEYLPYKTNKTKTYKGRCLAIVQSGDKNGVLTVRAKCKNLTESAIEIKVAK
jgi:Beta-galactosidase/beta-glucuronidase